jgi:hypothetical protein
LSVAFKAAEGWSRDFTMDIADEVRRHYAELDGVAPWMIRCRIESSG